MYKIVIKQNTVNLDGNADTFKVKTLRAKLIIKQLMGIGIETDYQTFKTIEHRDAVASLIRTVCYSDINT